MGASPRFRSTRSGLAIIVVLLIGAFALRLWDLNAPSVWHDEGWSIRAIRDPINTPDDNTPPVYYSLMHFLWLGAGETPLALRYGSVLLDVITIAGAARFMRHWAGWDAAILVVALLGVSPLLWAYAREIRAYVMVPLLALVLLGLADRLLATHTTFPWRVWGALLLAELVLLYTHNLSVPVVAWLNVAIGGVWLWQRAWKPLSIWIVGQAALLAAYVPWLLGQSPSGTTINTPPSLRPALVWELWQGYFAPLPPMIGEERAVVVSSALFGTVALACAAAVVIWDRRRETLLVLSQAVLLPVFATAELLAANIDFHPRYYIAGIPATLMMVALGINSLPVRDMRRLAIPTAMALAWGVGAASVTALLDESGYQHDDFRTIAEYYAGLPEDAMIVIPYGWEPAIEVYYSDRLDIRAEIVGIDLHSDASIAIDTINAALEARDQRPVHVELLTWYQLPADLRGMYSCLLESAGHAPDSVLTVQGITSTAYTVERPLALIDVPLTPVDYGAITLEQAASGGQQAVCVRTGWEQAQRTDQDWRVAARLLTTNPPGWVVARSDTDIRTAGQVPTSDWAPGDQGAGFSLLRYPQGAPPGEYAVQVIVFSQDQPDGADRLVNGVPAGRILSLTTVQPVGTTLEPFPEPPTTVSVEMDEDVRLVGHDAKAQTLNAGQELRITLYWQIMGDCCTGQPWEAGTVSLRSDGWVRSQPVAAYATYSRDWHTFVISAEASGPVTLTVESGTVEPITLATVMIEQTDRLFAPPPFDVPVQTTFDNLAVLEGFSVVQTAITPDDALDLTLVWRVTETSALSYRVFTHLLGADGRVIAQHDGLPVNGTRLTTGWVPGEYIVDPHALTFLTERSDYRGPAHLEVGFYDPETGDRVPVANGADHIVLPIEITVQ